MIEGFETAFTLYVFKKLFSYRKTVYNVFKNRQTSQLFKKQKFVLAIIDLISDPYLFDIDLAVFFI